MDAEGPPLEWLTRRLADCPADFLAEPRMGSARLASIDHVRWLINVRIRESLRGEIAVDLDRQPAHQAQEDTSSLGLVNQPVHLVL